MSTASNAKASASKFLKIYQTINTSRVQIDNITSYINTNWQGEASESYLEIHKRARKKSFNLEDNLNNISKRLNYLSDQIRRADEEERAKKAAAAKAAKKQSNAMWV